MDRPTTDISEEIAPDYPGLRLVSRDGLFATYRGMIGFQANHANQGLIEEDFEVEIVYPCVAGDDLPTAKEVGGRIPQEPDFHINPDGTMCLGTPHAVRQKWNQERSLQGFVNLLVVPFLYFFSFQQKHGRKPFGDLAHGGEGVLAYYRDLFGVSADLPVLEFLKIIIEDHYRGHIPCACGSGSKLRACHGQQIRDIKNQQTRRQFFEDFVYCLRVYKDAGNKLPGHFFTKRFRSCWQAMAQKQQS